MPNTNKPMVDLPYFELCSQSPAVPSATGCMTTDETGNDRFIYSIVAGLLYRYDTVADTWQQLATPNVVAGAYSTLRYTSNRGYHATVLSATSTTVTIGAPRGAALNGEKLRVLVGVGAAQERVLTLAQETVHEAGALSSVPNTSSVADNTKKWRVNQWAGYMVAITIGTTVPQYKRILHNTDNVLTVADVNLQPHEPWQNQVYAGITPYSVPTTGMQYQIMSSTFTVDAWGTVPAAGAGCTTLSGALWLMSTTAAAPFMTLQYYDIIADSWQSKTVPQGLHVNQPGTDGSIERTGRTGAVFVTNTGAVSATNRTLQDAGLALEPGRYANHRILITSGTGAGQNRRIVTNTATTFTIPKNWDVAPDATSTYQVWPNFDQVFYSGGAWSAMLAFSPENDHWMQGQTFDEGIALAGACTLAPLKPFGIGTGVRIAAGIQAVNPVPTAGGANFVLGDVLTCAVGGAGAQVRVKSVGAGGTVTGIELHHAGTTTGYTTGAGKAVTGGTGTGCTIEITAAGPTALITLNTSSPIKLGDVVTFAGLTDANWNAAHAVIGANSTTTFSVVTTAAASMVSAVAQSTTVIYDTTKNWIVNEHVGRIVHLTVVGLTPTSQIRWIVSNTSNGLTVATLSTAAGNGSSRYVIYDAKIFGIDDQRKETGMLASGFATGGSTTTLADTTKNWDVNQWAGNLFKVEAGTGYGSGRITIISNTANTLTYAAQGFTPDATTRYEIADAWGLATSGALNTINDTTKKWSVNQWINKRIRGTAGTTAGLEAAATANTATGVTVALGTPDATTAYAVIGVAPRGAGTALLWAWGGTNSDKRGRYIYSPRGSGSSAIDIYDIVTDKWVVGAAYSGNAEMFNTGSSYAYDGADAILLSRSVQNFPIRIFRYDINTNRLKGLATTSVLQNTVHVGNYMELVTSPQGYQYLYTLQNTGTLMQRALLF